MSLEQRLKQIFTVVKERGYMLPSENEELGYIFSTLSFQEELSEEIRTMELELSEYLKNTVY